MTYYVEQGDFSFCSAAAGEKRKTENGSTQRHEDEWDRRREEGGQLHVLVQLKLHPDAHGQEEEAARLK